mgnify:FL=1
MQSNCHIFLLSCRFKNKPLIYLVNHDNFTLMKLFKKFLIITTAGFLIISCKEKEQASIPENDLKEPSVEVTIENKENSSEITKKNVKTEEQSEAPKTVNQEAEKMPARKKYVPLTDEELKKTLTPIQYQVTKHEATERPWTNEFDKHFEEGIYVCIISGEPLFSSKDKYDSRCGWPAFTKPINSNEIENRTDFKIGYARTEVRAKTGDSHLGHVFNDGPPSKGGLRYCINSASLRFIPKAKLTEEGYGEFASLFDSSNDQ